MKNTIVVLVIAIIAMSVGYFQGCTKQEAVEPQEALNVEYTQKVESLPENVSEDSYEYEMAQAMMKSIQAYHKAPKTESEDLLPKGGVDSTVSLKPRLQYIYTGGVKWITFDLSIDSDTTIAQLNSMSYTIDFTGDLQPIGFNHALWPPSAIPFMTNGVLLENINGQTALGCYFSTDNIFVPSSTGQAAFGMPVVVWIAFTGTSGTVTLNTDPQATLFSKDGYNNYILGNVSVTIN